MPPAFSLMPKHLSGLGRRQLLEVPQPPGLRGRAGPRCSEWLLEADLDLGSAPAATLGRVPWPKSWAAERAAEVALEQGAAVERNLAAGVPHLRAQCGGGASGSRAACSRQFPATRRKNGIVGCSQVFVPVLRRFQIGLLNDVGRVDSTPWSRWSSRYVTMRRSLYECRVISAPQQS